ncbi:MAG: hypothetical protein EOP45_23585 [Sphingobacteriaceae bacterium]|nr:MAG: hypothetical protein EOP45_23585 [Sphingobacteriaceae bacterium]
MPIVQHKIIEVYLGKRKITVSQKAFENLFGPGSYSTIAHYNVQDDGLHIRSGNSNRVEVYGIS